ncbi:MAG: aldo/keto reductase [Chloroflexota bacterium]|nr:aldo/keto reductase [Chloroflexota bacterium]
MQTRPLGNTDMEITPIGFGAWAIGGGNWGGGWGSQDDQDSIAAINRAIDLGINWIDTAAVYGLGRSEQVVARALKGRTDRPYVFTKCGLVWDENRQVGNSLKADSIRKECEDSLRRLETDVIDLYQIHWPNPDEDIEEGWSTMAELQKEGKVRWIGVSNFSVEQMQRAQAIAPVSSLQPPYHLLKPEVEEEILPFCLDQGIGVINYSPMASGLLTGRMTRERIESLPEDDWRKRGEEFQEPNLSRNLELADLLGQIGERHGRSAAVVAIAWTLRHPAITGAIVGARRPEQVDGIIDAAEFRLSEEELAEIDAFRSRTGMLAAAS